MSLLIDNVRVWDGTNGTSGTAAAPPRMDFFYMMKKLTLTGYYTSEIGFAKELGKSIIPPGHAGCAPLPEASK